MILLVLASVGGKALSSFCHIAEVLHLTKDLNIFGIRLGLAFTCEGRFMSWVNEPEIPEWLGFEEILKSFFHSVMVLKIFVLDTMVLFLLRSKQSFSI